MPTSAADPGGRTAPTPAIVVSDAGPLIALGRLDLLHLPRALFSAVHVPDQVATECLARPDNLDAQRIRAMLDSGQLTRSAATPIDLPGLLKNAHHPGAGALVLFSGEVRDNNRGRAVAYPIIVESETDGLV